jgi:hypothetical protein
MPNNDYGSIARGAMSDEELFPPGVPSEDETDLPMSPPYQGLSPYIQPSPGRTPYIPPTPTPPNYSTEVRDSFKSDPYGADRTRGRDSEAAAAPIAPIRPSVEDVYNELQRRLKYVEELRKHGVPENALPKTGYVEGQTMPAYRPPGGLDYRYPGMLQRQFDDQTRPYVLPEELDYNDETRALKRRALEEYNKRYGRKT